MGVYLTQFTNFIRAKKWTIFIVFVIAVALFYFLPFKSSQAAFDPLNPLSGFTAGDLGGWDPGATPGDLVNPVTNQSYTGVFGWLAKALAVFILNCIMAAVYLVLWVFYSIAYGLTYLSEQILTLVLDPTFVGRDYLGGFTTKEFVRSAAQLLANLCNMLYLFVLIYIAIKAMFGGGNTRALLTKLVIAALLTNFGLVIAGVVIDFSQVAMYSVWEGMRVNSGSFGPGTKILDKLQDTLEVGRSTLKVSIAAEAYKMIFQDVGESLSQIIRIGGLITTALALVVTLVTITIILFIRIVMLWILLILTPAAFLFSILPQTEKWWNMWLENLTKYALTGPILIFFLWLGMKLSSSISNVQTLNNIGQSVANKEDLKYMFYALIAKNISTLFEMFTLIMTIWAGIIIANQFGIKGAKSLDKLAKYTGGLGLKMAEYIPWYTGRATNLLASATGGIMKRRSKILGDRAEEYRKAGRTTTADRLQENANWWQKKQESFEKGKNRAVKAFSVMNPVIVKKQFANWWNERTKDYMTQSEASVDEFGRDIVRAFTGQKSSTKEAAESRTRAKINEINRDFKKKYSDLEQTRANITNTNANINAVKSINQPVINQHNQAIQTLEGQISSKEAQVDRLRQQLKAPGVVNPAMIRGSLKIVDEEKKHLENEKSNLEKEVEEAEERIKIEEEKMKIYRENENIIKGELTALGSSLAEFATEDPAEKTRIDRESRIIANSLSGALPAGYMFTKRLDARLGYTGTQSLAEKAKALAVKKDLEILTEHSWQREKFEKDVTETYKNLDKYTPEEVEDMVLKGYGDKIMRTALFRKLSSMPQNFSNFLMKTITDFQGDEQKAISHLQQRFSEKELTKAFKAADVEARRSNNLFPMGYVLNDKITGRVRFTRGQERPRVLADFAKGMTPENINHINPQTFKSDEGLRQLAQNVDWEKLARNPRFVDSMSKKTRVLFKNKQTQIENHMTPEDVSAFRKIINI